MIETPGVFNKTTHFPASTNTTDLEVVGDVSGCGNDDTRLPGIQSRRFVKSSQICRKHINMRVRASLTFASLTLQLYQD